MDRARGKRSDAEHAAASYPRRHQYTVTADPPADRRDYHRYPSEADCRPRKRQRTRSRSPPMRSHRYRRHDDDSHGDQRRSYRSRSAERDQWRPVTRRARSPVLVPSWHRSPSPELYKDRSYDLQSRRRPVQTRHRSRDPRDDGSRRTGSYPAPPLDRKQYDYEEHHKKGMDQYGSWPPGSARSDKLFGASVRSLEAPRNFVIDTSGDPDNIKYGFNPASSVPLYRRVGYGRVMGVEEDQKIDRTQSTKQEIIMCEGRRREKGKDVGGERAEFWGKAGFGALVNHIDEGLPTWMKECPKSGETLDRDMDPQDQRPDLIKLEGEGDASSGIATHIRRPGPDNRDFFAFRYDN